MEVTDDALGCIVLHFGNIADERKELLVLLVEILKVQRRSIVDLIDALGLIVQDVHEVLGLGTRQIFSVLSGCAVAIIRRPTDGLGCVWICAPIGDV